MSGVSEANGANVADFARAAAPVSVRNVQCSIYRKYGFINSECLCDVNKKTIFFCYLSFHSL